MPRCSRCALAVPAAITVCGRCLRHPPAFDRAITAVDYGHPWDALVGAFKFRAALDLAGTFSRLMTQARRDAAAPHPGLLLPIPLAVARLRERGYNQAWELARRCARSADTSCDARLLLRPRETVPQLALPTAKRAANVRGAFAVDPLRIAELQGRHVTLVDDVMTTGATLAEAATVLREAGAASVGVWVLARTPAPEAPGARAHPEDG